MSLTLERLLHVIEWTCPMVLRFAGEPKEYKFEHPSELLVADFGEMDILKALVVSVDVVDGALCVLL